MRHRCSSSVLAAAVAATLAAPSALAQASAKSLSERSFAQAREVLEAAMAAAGGREALRGVRDVTRKGTGTVYNQGQSLVPEPPYTTRAVEVTSVVDFANRKSATETATTPQGGVPGKSRAVLTGDAGFALNLVTNVLTPSTPGGVAGLRTGVRRDPAALLLTVASRADTLRYLGEDSFAGAPHHVATFADSDGTQIALYVDRRTNLVSKYETLADNAVLGDALTEVVFSDYRAVDGVKLPFRVVSRTAGEETQDLKYTDVRVNAGPAPGLFQTPPEPVAGVPTGPSGTVSVRKLADDVYLAEGSSHNSLFVAFADHVVLVEAPQSEERVAAVLARIRETVPGKPVRYVVPTHHHFDHSGGLRAAVAAGATVITTPGNKAFIEQMARTAHTIRPDALSGAAATPKVETFTGRRVLTDGTRTLELHDIGPNPHVKEAVIAYLPREKMAFQADLIGLPAQGPLPPASPATVDFVQKVRQRGLQVDTIVGSHGRVGTMDEVVKAVEAQAAGGK